MNSAKSEVKLRTDLHRAMLRREADLGGRLFGEIEDGRRREFFCLDAYTWVWHEEWKDENGHQHIQTTRYDVRLDGIYKSQEGIGYKKISAVEAKNMKRAVELYLSHVAGPLYGQNGQLAV